MRKYLAEAFLPKGRADVLGEIAARLGTSAAAVSREGRTVRLLHSFVVPADETCFHIYEAVSAQAVREASERAREPCLRVVEMEEARNASR